MLMPSLPRQPIATTFSGFHDIAASRGDGLHPLLLEALCKSGTVSGPPVSTQQNLNNVVHPDFSRKQEKPCENRSVQT